MDIAEIPGIEITNNNQVAIEGSKDNGFKEITFKPEDEGASLEFESLNLPNGVTYDEESKTISGTPDVKWNGDEEFRRFDNTIKVINKDGTTTSKEVKLVIFRDSDKDGIQDTLDPDDDNDGIIDEFDENPKAYDDIEITLSDNLAVADKTEVPARTMAVVTNKSYKVTTPEYNVKIESTETNGLSIDEYGELVGSPNISWNQDEKERTIEIPVKITYTDRDGKEVVEEKLVKVNVSGEAREALKYTPRFEDIEKQFGQGVSIEDIKNALDKDSVPENVTITEGEGTTLPDGQTSGTNSYKIRVEYGDGSADAAYVNITIKNAISNTPTVNEVKEEATEITGTGTPGAQIGVVGQLGDQTTDIGVGIVDNGGNWKISVPEGSKISVGDVIAVVQQENGKDPSEIISTTAKAIEKPVTKTPHLSGMNPTNKDIVIENIDPHADQITLEIGDQTLVVLTKSENGLWISNDGNYSVTLNGENLAVKPNAETRKNIEDKTVKVTAANTKYDPNKTLESNEGIYNIALENEYEVILPDKKVKVENKESLTDTEKSEVENSIRDVNPNLPEGANIEVSDNGNATITYKDGSTDIISSSDLIEQKTLAETTEPSVSGEKVQVENKTALTDEEKEKVKQAVADANEAIKDKIKDIAVSDDGQVTITYTDDSTDTITSDKLVSEREKKLAETTEPSVPGEKVQVENKTALTDAEKAAVKQAVADANEAIKDKIKDIAVSDTGEVTITYKDGSTDTISADKLVSEREKTLAETTEPNVPQTKVEVEDANKLTDTEKAAIKQAVTDANEAIKDSIKEIAVSDTGEVTITYTDNSTDTISADKVIAEREKKLAETTEPSVPGEKVQVENKTALTDAEKAAVKQAVADANEAIKDKIKDIVVSDKGEVTITYTDNSADTISADKVIAEREKTLAETTEPNVPQTKVEVEDASKLTDEEKAAVKQAVTDANEAIKDKIKDIAVSGTGEVTITYTDNSKDTIEAGKLVSEREKTLGETTEPSIPGEKVQVENKTALTDEEKEKVKQAVADVNEAIKDKIKEIAVSDAGQVTITYTDDSTDTITSDKLVSEREKKLAETTEPSVPGKKVQVENKTALTDAEKAAVKQAVADANKDIAEKIAKIEVSDTGEVTITYKDGSTDTISADKVIAEREKTLAEKTEVALPTEKLEVADTNNLTDAEKEKVKEAIIAINPNLPEGTQIVVDEKGNATITYSDGSVDKLNASDLVKGKQPSLADQTEVVAPTEKLEVADTNNLTDAEKQAVKEAIIAANPNLPEGTDIRVSDKGEVTITYSDGSVDKLNASDLVEGKQPSIADQTEVVAPTNQVEVADTNNLTEAEKEKVKEAIIAANPNLPEGTDITVSDKGEVTITYSDGSFDKLNPSDLVLQKQPSIADQTEVNLPAEKLEVSDANNLTDAEKEKVKEAIIAANPNLPEGTQIVVDEKGNATITYTDNSIDTITSDKLVSEKALSLADQIEVVAPTDKVEVADTNNLTEAEKEAVKEAILKANPNLPEGTKIEISDNGNATITYKDSSVDMIESDKLVETDNGGETDNDGETDNGGNTDNNGGNTESKSDEQKSDKKSNKAPDTSDVSNVGMYASGIAMAASALAFMQSKKRRK